MKKNIKNDPDFYLVPNECVPIAYPVKCWIESTCEYANKDDSIIVYVRSQIVYYHGSENILETEKVILVDKYQGYHVGMAIKSSIYVNILWKKDTHGTPNVSNLAREDIEIIALGKTYPDANSAWEGVHKAFEYMGKY